MMPNQAFFTVGLLLLMVLASTGGRSEGVDTTTLECPSWNLSNAVQSVVVGAGQTLVLGPNCSTADVVIKLHCEAFSTVILDGFVLSGGAFIIAGPNTTTLATAALHDVAVMAFNVSINATRGPALGVLLSRSGTSDIFVSVANFSLSCHSCTLTTGASTGASVAVGIALDRTAFVAAPGATRVNMSNVSLTLVNSTVTALAQDGQLQSAVAAIALVDTNQGQVRFANIHLVLTRSVVHAAVDPNVAAVGTTSLAVAVAGVVVGAASAATLDGVDIRVACSEIRFNTDRADTGHGGLAAGGLAIGVTSGAYGVIVTRWNISVVSSLVVVANRRQGGHMALAAGGIAFGTIDALTLSAVVLQVIHSNVTSSNQNTGSGQRSLAVGGVSAPLTNSFLSVRDLAVLIRSCPVLSSNTTGGGGYASATVGGVVAARTATFTQVSGSTFAVIGCGRVSCSSVSSTVESAATVAGVAVSTAELFVQINDTATQVSTTDVLCVNVAPQYQAAAAVGGFAVGAAYHQGAQVFRTSAAIAFSHVTCTSTTTGTATATVGGFAIGSSHWDVTFSGVVLALLSSSATCTATGSGFGSCAVAGVSVVYTDAGVAVEKATLLVANATAVNCTSTSTKDRVSAALAGVAVSGCATAISVRQLITLIHGCLRCGCYAYGFLSSTVAASAVAVGYTAGSAVYLDQLASAMMASNVTGAAIGANGAVTTVAIVGAACGDVGSLTHFNSTTVVKQSTVSATSLTSAIVTAAVGGCGVALSSGFVTLRNISYVSMRSTLLINVVHDADRASASVLGLAVAAYGGSGLSTESIAITFNDTNMSACVEGAGGTYACGDETVQQGTACCTRNATTSTPMPVEAVAGDDTSFATAMLTTPQMPPWSAGCDDDDGLVHHRTRTRTRAAHTQTFTSRGSTFTHTPSHAERPRWMNATARQTPSAPQHHHRTSLTVRAHLNRTRTMLLGELFTPSSAPPSSTPSTKASSPQDVLSGSLGLSNGAANAVVVTAFGSTVVASAISPTDGNKAIVSARLVHAAACPYFSGSSSSFPTPNSVALLPPLSSTKDNVSQAAAMIISTMLLMGLVVAVQVVSGAVVNNYKT